MRTHYRIKVTPAVLDLVRRLAAADHMTRFSSSKRVITYGNVEVVYEDRGSYLKLDCIRVGSVITHYLAFTRYLEDAKVHEDLIAALCVYTENTTILVGEDYVFVEDAKRPVVKPAPKKSKGFFSRLFAA